MRFFAVAALAVSMTGVANAWTQCMLDCMSNSTQPAGCGTNYNATSCMCSNAQFVTLTRTCFYTACVNDIYPWYNLREAECGTLAADLNSTQFIPSNGNSTYDRAQAANGSAGASSSASASRTSTAATSGGAATSAAAAATSSRAAATAALASLGDRTGIMAAVGLGGAVLGGLMAL